MKSCLTIEYQTLNWVFACSGKVFDKMQKACTKELLVKWCIKRTFRVLMLYLKCQFIKSFCAFLPSFFKDYPKVYICSHFSKRNLKFKLMCILFKSTCHIFYLAILIKFKQNRLGIHIYKSIWLHYIFFLFNDFLRAQLFWNI